MPAVARIVVITGLPSSGKSTVAAKLRENLAIPLIAKDEIKERLFDELGTGDRDWSRRLSRGAYSIMFAQAEELSRCAQRFILEGNFRWLEHESRFRTLTECGARFVQIHCRADSKVLIERFLERARSGRRHPGHVDIESFAEIERELAAAEQRPLPLIGATILCETGGDWRAAIDRACATAVAELADR